MGLITKEVEVGIRGSNTKYYEDLGYTMPLKMNKYGKMVIDQDTKIVVKVEDLKPNSGIKVDTECDCCSKPSRMTYQGYTKHLHNGFIYCRNCALKILNSGENHPLWNPNLTKEERIEGRHYTEYTDFIKLVMARDNYTCQCCGDDKGGNINAHHKDGYHWAKDRRVEIDNGVTLCEICHNKFHSIYGNRFNTEAQFNTFIIGLPMLVKILISITDHSLPRCYGLKVRKWLWCICISSLLYAHKGSRYKTYE